MKRSSSMGIVETHSTTEWGSVLISGERVSYIEQGLLLPVDDYLDPRASATPRFTTKWSPGLINMRISGPLNSVYSTEDHQLRECMCARLI